MIERSQPTDRLRLRFFGDSYNQTRPKFRAFRSANGCTAAGRLPLYRTRLINHTLPLLNDCRGIRFLN